MISNLELMDAYNIMVKAQSAVQSANTEENMPSIARGACLGLLLKNGPTAQCDLAKQLYISPAAVSTLIKRMEKANLVSRRLAPGNAKLMIVSLSEEGRKQAEQMTEYTEKVASDLFSCLTEEERDMAYRIFHKITVSSQARLK